MRTPTDEDNAAFNQANQHIENVLNDNDPHTRTPEGPFAEMQAMLCLIWKAVGGEVAETWQEKRERQYKEREKRSVDPDGTIEAARKGSAVASAYNKAHRR